MIMHEKVRKSIQVPTHGKEVLILSPNAVPKIQMITHDEVRQHNKTTSRYVHVEKYWDDYITQQEKVSKLLELYRQIERNKKLNEPSAIMEMAFNKEITKLESELK